MRIGFLITARLKSSRLPLKIMKDLNGKPVIQRIVERAQEIHSIDDTDIVICTSASPQDKPLRLIAETTNVSYFLGDPDDVVKRLHDAAISHHLDYALGITADNPLFSIQYANKIVDVITRQQPDFIKVQGLPFGTAVWGMNVQALQTICIVKTIIDTEIWGYLIDRPDLFDVFTLTADKKFHRPNYRLTLDYKEDYELINHLYTTIPFKTTLTLEKVIEYLDKHPQIAAINAHCVQLDLDKHIKDQIDNHYHTHFQEIRKIKQEIYSRKKE
ncbi:MAG: 3-deoxy-manno-octulosonate cytidylyltransferase [Thermoplasmata archaeon M11B2D]|nr:MAG: 3-deoxy-manno-octulosonate cytidylyltransferase [Thermoplasmata archaeon M11B2D]PNX52702.1 MAG: 3-deoxy-manno-octulosonate cytidylyltransferase [Thermoplasmata archaeon M9B2D]